MDLIKNFLKDKYLLSISVIENNKPWSATVNFAEDEKVNLYFLSSKITRHSVALESSPFVSGTIYSHESEPEGKKEGIQFSGEAARISNPIEITKAYKIFRAKYPKTKLTLEDMLQIAIKSSFYKITIKYIKYFNSEMDPKILEFNL